MSIVVLLAILVSMFGCGSDTPTNSDNPDRQKDAQADTTDPSDIVDPFVDGYSYRLAMTTQSTPGLEKSSTTVTVFIREFVNTDPAKKDDVADKGVNTNKSVPNKDADTDKSANTDKDADTESSKKLVAGAELQLDWQCGNEPYRGNKKVAMHRLDTKVDVPLTELPELKRINDSIKCEIKATLDTTTADGKRVIATGLHEFYIEMDVLYPALQLHGVEITNDANNADKVAVALKVTLIRQGKVVVKGDAIFDEAVGVDLTWVCNDNTVAANRSKSSAPTDLTIAAGKAEAEIELNLLPDTTLGEGGYACFIMATSKIKGYERKVEGKKKIWIEGKDLQVAVTSVTNTQLSYVVMTRYQRFNGNVKLILESCSRSIANNDNTLVSSQGQVTLTPNNNEANSCKLKAQVLDGNNQAMREGESNQFTIPSALRQMEKI